MTLYLSISLYQGWPFMTASRMIRVVRQNRSNRSGEKRLDSNIFPGVMALTFAP